MKSYEQVDDVENFVKASLPDHYQHLKGANSVFLYSMITGVPLRVKRNGGVN